MIKFTLQAVLGKEREVFISPRHIIALQHGNPSGTVITTTRGLFHVAQSMAQVLTLMEGK